MENEQKKPDFEQMSKDMQEEIEKLHVRIAKGFAGGSFHMGLVKTLQRKWSSLSYIEKVYTISMLVIAGSFFVGQAVAIIRKER